LRFALQQTHNGSRRFADKALLTFAYYNLHLSYLSTYVTLGALVSGDLHKLHWLSIVERVPMCPESSMFAARYGHTDILKWLYQIEFPIHAMTGREAAFQGHLGILQLLHAAGHEWHHETFILAVQAGHLDVALWLSKHGCAYDVTQATVQAAYFGHIDILHWLLQQAGAPMGPRLMYVAAKGGQLLVCQHLRELDCAWDSTVSAAAACNGHLSVLQYLHEHGCPWVDNAVAMLSAAVAALRHWRMCYSTQCYNRPT
jgi:hypothetical protein